MELDEFKTYWNTIQDKEFKNQKLTTKKLDQIIMKTTKTLDYLQKKSAYWSKVSKINKPISQILMGMLIPFSLIILVKASFMAGKTNSIGPSLTYVGTSLIYMAIIVIYCYVTVWVFKRQLQIFTVNNSENLKETLRKTITDFKRFYMKFNIIYLFLYPMYYYAVIKLIIITWTPSTNNVLLTCAILTIVSLLGGHVYYKLKYFNKIKLLEANLKELEDVE